MWPASECCFLFMVYKLLLSIFQFFLFKYLLTASDLLKSIRELVKVGNNGLIFSSSSELAEQLLVCFYGYFLLLFCSESQVFPLILDECLQILFRGFPDKCNTLRQLRDGALATGLSGRWSTGWEQHALPLIEEARLFFIHAKTICNSAYPMAIVV